jgi:hypothetical protein
MRVVVAVPELATLVSYQSAAELLKRPICGVPLLADKNCGDGSRRWSG